MAKKRVGRLGFVLLLSAAAGCARLGEGVYFTDAFAGPGSAYGRALGATSRKAELYQGFDTVAKGWATWKTRELRTALVEESIRRYHLEGTDAETLRTEEDRAGRRGREFHLALYTPKKQWNDLESPNTLWRAHLVLPDGTRVESVEVVHLPKSDRSSVEYPYVTPWTREYSIVFPLLEGEETFQHATLELAGVLGTLRFEF